MYNYYPQNQQPRQSGLKGRPVSSLEEAKAQPIDFDGSIFFFPDLVNKKIYTKQINLDGTMLMSVYEMKEYNPAANNYVTHEELERILQRFVPSEPGAAQENIKF